MIPYLLQEFMSLLIFELGGSRGLVVHRGWREDQEVQGGQGGQPWLSKESKIENSSNCANHLHYGFIFREQKQILELCLSRKSAVS